MTSLERPAAHKVLLVDDDNAVREMMTATLEYEGLEVVAANVSEALRFITTQNFDVLITDLHMPNAGDGFTVVSAMRHSQPHALTLLVSGYPDVQSAMDTIPLGSGRSHRETIRSQKTSRTHPRKDVCSQTCISELCGHFSVAHGKNVNAPQVPRLTDAHDMRAECEEFFG